MHNIGFVPESGIIVLNNCPTGSNPDPGWTEARIIDNFSYLVIDNKELKLKFSGEPDLESAVLTKQGLIYVHPDYISKAYRLRYVYLTLR